MPRLPEHRLMVSRGAALASGVLALLGATAAVSFMPLPPPGPTPGNNPPPPVVTPAPVAQPTAVPPAVAPPRIATPPPAMPGPTSTTTGAAGTTVRRFSEIVPPPSYGAFGAPTPPTAGAPGRTDPWASVDPCVSVFVRATKVDGRELVSADLHGDGLIKAAVPPHLAGQLLARAGPVTGTGGARTACVPTALAQSLFDPVVNLAAVDPAVRMVRVGERWVLAGSRAPEPVAKAQAPVQLAAATTRGAAKKPTRNSTKRATPRPVQVSYNIYP
jgi:hypothetical protein